MHWARGPPAGLRRSDGRVEWNAGTQVRNAGDFPTSDDGVHQAARIVQKGLSFPERQFIRIGSGENVPAYAIGITAIGADVIRILAARRL